MDARKLKLREISEIERRAKCSIRALDDPAQRQGDLLTALAYVMLQRSDPEATWKQAAELDVSQLAELTGGVDLDTAMSDSPLAQSSSGSRQ